MIEELYNLLWNALIFNCPTDTGFMSTNIYLYDYGEYYSIKIETHYAQFVNYNRQRTPKEVANFHWVERTIKQVAEMTGANIQYEIA